MNNTQISAYQSGIGAIAIFALLVLFVCFLDGPLYALYDLTGTVPPNLLIFPTVFATLAFWYAAGGQIQFQGLSRVLLIAILFLAWWLVQGLFGISVYAAGYLQLAAFLCLLSLVRAAFATDHGQDLASLLGRSLLIIHYLFAFYILLTFLVWHMTGRDISLFLLLNPTPTPEFINYRPAGLSREPAWAAITLAASYLGVHYLYPEKRAGALIVMILAFILIRTGTSIAFLGALLTFMAFERSEGKDRLGWTILLGAVGAAIVFFVLWDRLVAIASFSDPSANMRLASVNVALEVIGHDVLLGVGYGNFQEYAAYGAEFDNFIDLFRATLYKSDIAFLNLWAEMGVFGLLIAYFFAATFYNSKTLPLMILPVLILVLNGALLLPQLFVLAAIAGTLDYRS